MKPYYEHAGIQIYLGDCREILPSLGEFDSVIVDPPWPNFGEKGKGLSRRDDPFDLLQQTLSLVRAKRIVVHLGMGTDPRFLLAVPAEYKFLRLSWLRYAFPGFKGKLMMAADIAYAFGEMPQNNGIIPGESRTSQPSLGNGMEGHPCPRRIQHLMFLVRYFSEGLVCDPLCGIGTTLRAAKKLGRPAVGIEIHEPYCEIAAKRLSQEVLEFT